MKAAWDVDTKIYMSKLDGLIDEYVVGPKSGKYRKILRLHFFEGLTYEEIAEALELSAVQVGRIVRRYEDPLLLMI